MEDKTFFEDFKAFQEECQIIPLDSTAKIGKYSFKYASLGSIIRIVRPILHKHNFIQYWKCEESGAVTCVLEHKSGEDLTTSTVMIKSPDDPKQQGAAITYARRYSLVALLGIVAEEDKDAPSGDTVKKKMSSVAFQKACDRIKEGNKDVIKDCLLYLNVSEDQKDKLAELEFEYNG